MLKFALPFFYLYKFHLFLGYGFREIDEYLQRKGFNGEGMERGEG